MRAGFGRANITPPAGTKMLGFGGRDRTEGCKGVHDPLYARALYLEHGNERALILAYDLCFFSRETADRYKGALGRALDLTPRQILMNFSHTHAGANTGMWAYSDYAMPDIHYLRDLEAATLRAAEQACDATREVDLFTGVTRTSLPLSRRRVDATGYAQWVPAPEGPTYDRLPLALFKDDDGKPVALLFSVSCHPSTVGGHLISADYPGVACERLNDYLGADCSIFLQGVGGDTKARVIGDGDEWRSGRFGDVDDAGEIVATEAIRALDAGLSPTPPALACALHEMRWPLQPLPAQAEFIHMRDNPHEYDLKRLWAERMVQRLERGEDLPDKVPVLAHGMQIGEGARLLGLEGEAVAEWGPIIAGFYGGGVTFPMGYTDGTALYLPVTRQLPELGYEVESYFEYGAPAALAPGMEEHVLAALGRLRAKGIG
ncbi:MAG: hypothetical protein ACYDCO_00230 [Armatimonadota bacterium]